mmetsp:Transcript_11839/g.31833  ORF Transcript_11839/g.31833 Transcript_11839/m.31833 type:complete len:180 (-) Transcript_11839:273-812(-)
MDSKMPSEEPSQRISPYAMKLMMQVVMWISSIIVFGSTAELSSNRGTCNAACGYAVATGVISFLHLSLLLVCNFLTEINRLSRQTWFSHQFEAFNMYLLVFWWIPGVANIASVRSQTPGTGQVFAFVAFYGSMYGAFKAYHSYKEEEYRLEQEHNEQERIAAEQELAFGPMQSEPVSVK